MAETLITSLLLLRVKYLNKGPIQKIFKKKFKIYNLQL